MVLACIIFARSLSPRWAFVRQALHVLVGIETAHGLQSIGDVDFILFAIVRYLSTRTDFPIFAFFELVAFCTSQ